MIHVPQLITDLALILGAAGITTLIFKKLKQPLVLGYIIAGLLVGPNFNLFPTIGDIKTIQIWAEIGVIFLLFSLGLEFSFKKLVKVGGPATITAVTEVVGMLAMGFLTGKLLGWNTIDSIFLGGILSISSTTIIIRAFDELGVKTQKFAGFVFGILVVEDLVAILLLVLLSTLAASQQFAGTEMLNSVLRLAFFLAIWFLAGIYLVPTFLRKARKLMNDETLLVISVALCLLMVILATNVGFSPALGAFIMGSILAETVFAEKIEHLTKSVKELFGAVFFVSVGMLIDPAMLVEYAGPVLIITLATIFGKALSSGLGALLSGQSLKQSIQAGLSLAQIGEFSFIIATLGLTLKVTSGFLYPIAVAVSAITTFTTPYLIRSAEPVHRFIESKLPASWLATLENYSSGAQTITQVSNWQVVFRSFLQVLVVNGVVLLGLILLTINFLAPFMKENVPDLFWANLLTAVISLAAMAPFVWALAVQRVRNHSYRVLWRDKKYSRGPLVILELLRIALAVVLVSFLLDQLFSLQVALITAFILIIVVIPLFTHRLRKTYTRIEKRFLLNLNARENAEDNPVARLLPWDAHLTELQVSPDAQCVGKTLIELAFREQYGVNIVQIERGQRNITIPKGDERLLPGDAITVIGTDEQLEEFQKIIEAPDIIAEVAQPEISLKQVVVRAGFPFLGKNIRESRIREKTNGLIVGIERNGERILNPPPTTVFEKGDIVWLAGDQKLIREISLP